jgi:hypothetical protein
VKKRAYLRKSVQHAARLGLVHDYAGPDRVDAFIQRTNRGAVVSATAL